MRVNFLVVSLAILAACNDKNVENGQNSPVKQPEIVAEAAEKAPPQNYRDEGQCPYEGCIYGNWTVEKATTIYNGVGASEPAFEIKPGDKINAVTGVVITKELGQVEALKDVELHGELDSKSNVKKGDIIYVLNYEGEGVFKLWHEGKIVYEQLDAVGTDQKKEYTQQHLLGLKTIKLPVTEWWIKIQNSKGQQGWTNEPKNFGNRDRYG